MSEVSVGMGEGVIAPPGKVEVWSKLEERRRGRAESDASERRSALRYPVSRCSVRLKWWGAGSWVVGDGELVEIGMGGTSLVSEGAPGVGRPVWLWLASEGSGGQIRGEVVGCAGEAHGVFRVRVTFPEGCPYEVFKRLVWGMGSG